MDVSEPTVIVENVHLVHKVIGRAGRGGAPAALKRLVTREQAPGMRRVHAVRGVSFTAHRGEAIGLIGPNGSGKSTLLRAIAGLMPPTEGTIWTQGHASLLGVSAAMMGDMTGERNVVLGCLALGMSRAEIKERYQEIADFADIGDFISMPMSTYSSGMGARLRFSIAATQSHDILLIDEALATGDARFRRRSEKRIRELREDAGTVFLVSHGLGVVRSTCERAIWLEQGKIIADGPSDDVVAAYERRHDPEALELRLAALQAQNEQYEPSVHEDAAAFADADAGI
jgi:teichoic acid transport system ATP-binding protein